MSERSTDPRASKADSDAPAVLVVDDEADILEVFSMALEGHFHVWTARSAREAVEILEREPIRVVVADHRMPGGEGLNLLVWAREQHPSVRRVLVTGYAKPETLLRAMHEAAVCRYLTKPVALPALLRAVQEALVQTDVPPPEVRCAG